MTETKKEVTYMGSVKAFVTGRACSDTIFHVLNAAYDKPDKNEENALQPMAGGIMQHGYQCGMIWGAALGAGAQAHRLYGSGPLAETAAINAAQRLVETFRTQSGHINCLEITNIDHTASVLKMITYFLLKGGTIGCFKRSGRYGPAAFKDVEAVFSEKPQEVPEPPVSCAALLAVKLGRSEKHRTTVAGLAGGIGLCGGACGAMGAAVWFIGLKNTEQSEGKVKWKDPKALETIEKFLKCTNYKMECSEIVGRKFENASDHAAYLRQGGCSEILEVLTEAVTA
jgi:hypothetical protein